MKLKGVNPLEQHVEKIVLAGVSCVFLGVLATQFLGEHNLVKVGDQPAVRPDKAFVAVENRARELQGIMEQKDLTDKLPAVPAYDPVNQLRTARAKPLVSDTGLALGPSTMMQGADTKVAAQGAERFAPLAIPAPTHAIAGAYRATLDPTEPENIPALKAIVPTEQPMDIRAVSVACSFDGTALKSALSSAPEGGDTKAIPTSWWRDAVEILAVRLERSEQKADGTWADATEIPVPPGRFSIADRLKDVKSTDAMADALAEVRGASEEVQRPAFYRTIAGAHWTVPVEGAAGAVAAAVKDPAVDRLVTKVTNENKTLDRLKKSRDETANAPVKQAPRPGGGGGDGGGGGKGAGGGQTAPAPQTGGPTMTQQEKDGKLKLLDRQIKDAEAQIAKDTEALKALGRDITGKPLSAETPAPGGDPSKVPAAKPLLENAELKLWTHDLTAQPGKTYRYRVKVAVNNPLFARTSALLPDQQAMASSALAYSQPSEWTEPVQVLPDQFFVLTGATEADQFGPPRATAEVFRFFYGYYRKASISLEPGDSISANIKLPDPAKLPIYDLKAVANPATPAAPNTPEAPAPGGKGGGRGMAPGPGSPRGTPGQPETKAVTLPSNAKPYPKPTIPASIDTMLLDVAKAIASGEGGARSQAYLRGSNGQIQTLVPEEQRKLAAYQLAAASAKEGETQGQPAAPSTEPKQDQNQPQAPKRGPERQPPPPPPGGGGGGAGGG